MVVMHTQTQRANNEILIMINVIKQMYGVIDMHMTDELYASCMPITYKHIYE